MMGRPNYDAIAKIRAANAMVALRDLHVERGPMRQRVFLPVIGPDTMVSLLHAQRELEMAIEIISSGKTAA